MKTKPYLTAALLFALASIFSSCKKEQEYTCQCNNFNANDNIFYAIMAESDADAAAECNAHESHLQGYTCEIQP